MMYVNIYLTNRAYGGPEEGGWWYDCGEAVRSFPVVTQRRASRILAMVRKIADCRNKQQNSDLSSITCDGRYQVMIEETPAANYPETIPHYE